MSLKIMSWNVEHADRLVAASPSAHTEDRARRIRATIEEINPDLICMGEGPKGEQAIHDFCARILNGQWVPVLMRQDGDPLGARDAEYQTKGTQWIWFLVKEALRANCRLQSPEVWQSFVGANTWTVFLWGEEKPTRHSHYRHPQVLIYDLGNGRQIEFIGVHLKSKINQQRLIRDEDGNLTGEYLKEGIKARIKLATEARNIRGYISAKFEQLAQPGLVVMGDCNDGPGQDFFETNYLFFDLIGNVQGEVLIAERFFNHSLFDFPGHLRWSAKYKDEVVGIPASQNPLLLDHILISQPLCRGQLPLIVNEHAGQVEHEAYERHNAGSNTSTRTSDHRPVSCQLDSNV
ncbi:MAG: endonuclease/exonuclease/phosphatase family protein [Desulfomonile tiedjei]|nr:endonuclease/exonuclease/phosphatase family protein [Desulfomonile tiedjei]